MLTQYYTHHKQARRKAPVLSLVVLAAMLACYYSGYAHGNHACELNLFLEALGQ